MLCIYTSDSAGIFSIQCYLGFFTFDFSQQLVWLVWWVLWHINLCRLFNAKSIFMKVISFISNNSVQHEYTAYQKHFYFKQFSLFKQLYNNSV